MRTRTEISEKAMAAARGGVIQILEARPPPLPWIPSRATTIRFKEVVDEVEVGGGALLSLRSIRRRVVLWLSLPTLAAVVAPSTASALSLGIPGPKDWLREQKKKSAKFVLAPIEASRETLRSAYGLLRAESQGEKSQEVIRLLNLASRDCVPQQRNTLVQFQSQTGVEVCTFRLVVKNAASLLDKNDPVKLEAEASLDDLISKRPYKHQAVELVNSHVNFMLLQRSFSFLWKEMTDCNFQIETDREKLRDGLMDTISSLDRFEQGIKNCLGV